MIWFYLSLFSHLIFIPRLFDSFSLPKRVYVFALSLSVAVALFRRRRALPLLVPISLYAAIASAPVLWAHNLYFIERLALDFTGFMIFWVIATEKITEKELKIAAFSIWPLLFLLQAFRLLSEPNEGMIWPLGNPSYFAFLSIIAVPFSFFFPFRLALLTAVFGILVSTGSRAAVLSVLWAAIHMGLCYRKPRLATILRLVTPAIPVFFVIMVFGLNWTPIDNVRQATWLNSIAMIQDGGLLGFGRGQFEFNYPKYANARMKDAVLPSFHTSHPHNEFLNQVIETGILGASAFYVIVFGVLTLPCTNRSLASPLQVPILSSLVGIIFYSSFWFPFFHPSMNLTFWALSGLLWSIRPDQKL